MKRAMLAMALGAVTATASAQPRPGAEVLPRLTAAAQCERACLEALMNRYLAALKQRDHRALPFAPEVKFTENTNEMELGDGLWQTIDELLPSKLYIADPEGATVVFYGGVRENGEIAMLNVRLKHRAGLITEVEHGVIRKATGIFGDWEKVPEPLPAWKETLKPAERRSRQQLIALTNQYFEGIEQSNGDIVPFENGVCIRWENGRQTAPSTGAASNATPAASAPGAAPAPVTNSSQLNMGPLSCGQQFDTRIFTYIPHITQRRYLAVDEERGIVFASVMFQHPGNVLFADVPGRGRIEMRGSLARYPNTTNIIEAFRLKDGKITNIHAYVNLLPYRQKSGWE